MLGIAVLLLDAAANAAAANGTDGGGTDGDSGRRSASHFLPVLPVADDIGLLVGAALGAFVGACCCFAIRGVRAEVHAMQRRDLIHQTELSSGSRRGNRVSFDAASAPSAVAPRPPQQTSNLTPRGMGPSML